MKNTTDTAEQLATTHGSPRTFVRMFKPQFAPLVEAGTKCQTVRPVPKRMPRPGDIISLRCWTGKPYRSPQRVLREATVTSCEPLMLSDCHVRTQWTMHDREAFAKADGFSSWRELVEWFRAQHGLPFNGVLISWTNVADETRRG